ncbi:MAG TPA: SDR family oxidoreductase [Vicinamibacteria bacterium]|nr:SDR family oxidoreductase [Vicinamibacteria bacterium]
MFDLSGKTAVVTGSGSGIGEAIARLFARQGARVALLDVDEPGASGVAEAIRTSGGRAESWSCDVSNARQVQVVFSEVVGRFGRLDILVNNAGVAQVGDLLATSEDDLDRVFRVNVKGVYLCSKVALPTMLAQGGGVILNMASIASVIGVPERFAYSMSKGAVLTMTLSIAVDYVKRNIRCNCICPARIHTPFVDGYVAANYPGREAETLARLAAYQPVGRMGRPDEVAALALYLCSDEAAFVTGAAYPIDGGVLAL